MSWTSSTALLLVCGILAQASICPTVSCRDLDTGVCALVISSTEISITSRGCDNGYICTAKGLFEWLDRPDVVPGSNYACYPDNTGVTFSEKMSTKWPCYQRLESKNFYNNATANACASDEDCKLADSTIVSGSCVCGLRASNSLGICQPDYSSDTFAGYWEECGSDTFIEDSVIGYYWHLYMTYYPYVAYFDVPCATSLLEIADFKIFQTEYEWGHSLTLATGLWLGIVN